MSNNLMEFAKEYSRAWAVHNPAAIAAMHTDDSVFELHDVGAPATGRTAVRELIEALLTAVPDLRFEPKRAHFGAEHFVTEYLMSGTAELKPFAIAAPMCSRCGMDWSVVRTPIWIGCLTNARSASTPWQRSKRLDAETGPLVGGSFRNANQATVAGSPIRLSA